MSKCSKLTGSRRFTRPRLNEGIAIIVAAHFLAGCVFMLLREKPILALEIRTEPLRDWTAQDLASDTVEKMLLPKSLSYKVAVELITDTESQKVFIATTEGETDKFTVYVEISGDKLQCSVYPL
jgi:hypothetical protein